MLLGLLNLLSQKRTFHNLLHLEQVSPGRGFDGFLWDAAGKIMQ